MQRGTRALTGVGLVVLGALLGMLGLTVLPWYRSSLGGILPNGSNVANIRASINFYQNQDAQLQRLFDLGVSPTFFGGAGFVLLLVAALAAFAGAGVNARAGRVAAGVAVLAALGGLAFAAFAIRYVDIQPIKVAGTVSLTSPPSYLDFVTGSGFGAWAMVLGYLLVGVGAFMAAGSRDELRELLRDDEYEDDEPVPAHTSEPAEATAEPVERPGAPAGPVDLDKQRRPADEIW